MGHIPAGAVLLVAVGIDSEVEAGTPMFTLCLLFGGFPPGSASFRAPASSHHQDPVSSGPCQHLRPAALAAILMGVRWCLLVVLTWICLQ